jgi:DNA polymerase III epsilon subunit-like protein
MTRLCYIDVETTGLNANKHAIAQLAYIIEINGKVKARGSFRINPKTYNKPKETDKRALEINGLTPEVLDTFQDAAEVFKLFKEILNQYISIEEKLTFVGYNSPFDIKFVQALFTDMGSVDYGRYFTYKHLDVFALVKYLVYVGYFPDTKSHSLGSMCAAIDLSFDGHDAVADIEATRDLHKHLIEYIKVP